MSNPTRVPAPRAPAAPIGTVGHVVARHLERLQRGYLADQPAAVATLARLRRGAGKDAQAVPDLWGLIDTSDLYADPTLTGRDVERAETAVFLAMPLWALHQQSRRIGMHTAGIELGAAVRKLMPKGEIDEAVRKRFVRAGSASTLTILAVRLRELVLLLRRDELALDYALLTDQLFRWQRPGGPESVRASWGRSFHAYRAASESDRDATEAKESR
ncbi:type I-E CRISPR-associated protein Cse2/CasB [Mangrovactinospora gilvigrisea]|uniref:Type I-E CRISPR-associated protein Cse2/CasB n=1 Tax=Mangrovactinospora gilvigrisea TaxID=1428644 RepID=A0A1J7BHP7_9ACTN|nr:type I-E CRISPR-associated protein Cse2/CasB [Mangrovactinospora gilvigrisea]OIV38219.1 type I-E CRISPR-associated protein Cse2/CasB [Mangrovactinospora gilvigrisea]